MRSRWPVVVGVVVLTLASGCGDDDDDREPGIGNPASEFCEEQGGRVEMDRDDAGNERGMCLLPDGTRVDEWEYYREHGGE
jgi:putative hemolysin